MNSIFDPGTIGVVGATEAAGSVGRSIVENLIAGGFEGRLYPINPGRSAVLGLRCYAKISDVPQRLDLAVVVTPAPTVPGIVRECVDAGVKGAIIISAGFKESGPAGSGLENQILGEVRRGQMRIVGPNCLGVMMPHRRLNATFAAGMARPGSLAFISQSGALCTAILDWSMNENVGFSAFVSVGSMLDVGWGDLIDYVGDDPHTKAIVCYMESVGDARSFLSAAREVALTKPIILLKVGRTDAAAKATASHTGSLTGSDEVLDAALRRVGVLRVNSIAELFNMAEVLGKQPRPRGPRLSIITNAGGPAALSTDQLISSGGKLAELTPQTLTSLNELLPPHWSHGNPIDILGDARTERYARAVEIAAQDPNSDGLLVILTPQAMTECRSTAEALRRFAKLPGKPILASWMGGSEIEAGEAILNEAGIPTFRYPDAAARTFAIMWRYSENLRSLYETPMLAEPAGETGSKLAARSPQAAAQTIIQQARKSGRILLTELESKELLAVYGIPTVETRVAHSEEEAVGIAEKLGFPVVLKLHSETITHKTDVGGVQLNIRTVAGVRHSWQAIRKSVLEKAGAAHFLGVTVQPMVPLGGYELIVGSSIDPQFGPVLLFGTGGQLVEVFKDRALGLPPLTATLARRMMEQTRIHAALQGVRGRKPVDLTALEHLLVRFSHLVVEQPWIAEIDINPLLASAERLIALDARVVLHDAAVREDQLPRPAICPYPIQYHTPWRMRDGTPVLLRPIRPEDEPLMIAFHKGLSERSVYFRYFTPFQLSQRITHERLTRICFIDYDREIALVAEHENRESGQREIIGVARLKKMRRLNEAELAMIVTDPWQRHGLGTQLLKLLVQIGRDERLERITATILPENHEMQNLCRKAGFQLRFELGSGECLAELRLTGQAPVLA